MTSIKQKIFLRKGDPCPVCHAGDAHNGAIHYDGVIIKVERFKNRDYVWHVFMCNNDHKLREDFEVGKAGK